MKYIDSYNDIYFNNYHYINVMTFNDISCNHYVSIMTLSILYQIMTTFTIGALESNRLFNLCKEN